MSILTCTDRCGLCGDSCQRSADHPGGDHRCDGHAPEAGGSMGQSAFPTSLREAAACECIYSCADDPATECSLSGQWHVHPGWPCAVHPDAPGDHAEAPDLPTEGEDQ